MRLIRLALFLALTLGANAQTLTTATLTGKYSLRHVEVTTDANNNVLDARSIVGTITFSGAGTYVVIGQQVIGSGNAAAFSTSGTYSVTAAGLVTISNPQKPALNINARYAVEAVVGASTEATDNTFDLFIAIPAPAIGPSNAGLSGTYYATDFELPGPLTSQVRDSMVTLTMDGAGNVTTLTANGHAANVNSGQITLQTGTAGTYNVPAGTLALSGAALLNSATRTLALSASGNVFIAGTPGAHDMMIGVKALSGGAGANTSLAPSFWLGGLRLDTSGSGESYAGSGETINGVSITSTERLHETGPSTLDVTESNIYTVAIDGTGSYGPSKIGLGTGGNVMVSANLSATLDPTGYQIGFAAASPPLSGSSVFINPRGVVNAASNAPGVDYLSPGEFIAIYGSGLAAATVSSLPPYPSTVGGVTVTIGGLPAAIYFVSAGQIDCLVPYGVTGSSVNVSVNNGGTVSNTVTIPLAKTSPGIFSLDTTGTNDGAILDFTAGGSVVNATSPAVKGDTVELYLTGLGALTTPIADGHGATAADAALTQIAMYINGTQVPASNILYAGVSSLPGLYQINFIVPTSLTDSGELPLAILTPDAFHDQVTIAVQ